MNSSSHGWPAKVCARCLGRAFAKVGTGFSNTVRGNIVIFLYGILERPLPRIVEEINCDLCNGMISDISRYVQGIQSKLSGYEFGNFLVGSTFDEKTLEDENAFQEHFGNIGESIRKEFNRECGKELSIALGKEAEFGKPEITINVDFRYDSIRIQSSSLCISGFYRKFRRDLPQTRWIHMDRPGDSIEEIIGEPLREMTGSENFFLHGAGREDVDVRMLGNGRRFVIEAYRPMKRKIDLAGFTETVNSAGKGVEIFDTSFCNCSLIQEIKAEENFKSYEARVEFESHVSRETVLSAIMELSGKVIYQRTPLRVSSRRSDLVRERLVRSMELRDFDGDHATMRVTAQSGTYIKEMLHGDKGRTVPSLSSLCNSGVKVLELDVIQIHRGEHDDKDV